MNLFATRQAVYVFAAIALTILSAGAEAGTCVWSGSSEGGAWNVPGNWTCDVSTNGPTSTDDVSISNASMIKIPASTISIASLTVSIGSLELDQNATLNTGNLRFGSSFTIQRDTTQSSGFPTLNVTAAAGNAWAGEAGYSFANIRVNVTTAPTATLDLSGGSLNLTDARFSIAAGSKVNLGSASIYGASGMLSNAGTMILYGDIGGDGVGTGLYNASTGLLQFGISQIVLTEGASAAPKRIKAKTQGMCPGYTIGGQIENEGIIDFQQDNCNVYLGSPQLFKQTASSAVIKGYGSLIAGDAIEAPSTTPITIGGGVVSGELYLDFAEVRNGGATFRPGGSGVTGDIEISGFYTVTSPNARLEIEFQYNGEGGIYSDTLSIDSSGSTMGGSLVFIYLSSGSIFESALIENSNINFVYGGVSGGFRSFSHPATPAASVTNDGEEIFVTFTQAVQGRSTPVVSLSVGSGGYAGSSSLLSIAIQNTDTAPATGVSFQMTLPAGISRYGSSSVQTDCSGGSAYISGNSIFASGFSIAAGASCQVTLNVTGDAGSYLFVFPGGALSSSAGSNAAESSASLVLRLPPQAKISVSPSSLVFDQQTVGSSSDAKSVGISSTGDGMLIIYGFASTGEFSYASDCTTNAPVDTGGGCTIDVKFNPLTVGVTSGSIVVYSNAATGPFLITLTGEGTAVPVPNVKLDPASVAFDDTNVDESSAAKTITLTNSGLATLKISSVSATGPFALTNGCGATLAPKASCSLSVTFKPTAEGPQTGQVVVAHNAKGSTSTVALSGAAKPRREALIQLTGGGDLGDVTIGNTSQAVTVTISNSGNIPLVISSIGFSGANASDFAANGSCGSIAPTGSCSITVRFAPTASGVRNAAVSIASNAHNAAVATLAVTGRGVPKPAPVVALSAKTLGFGNVIYGTSASSGVTLSNTGNASLQIKSIASSRSDYTFTHTCGTSVPASGACTISVHFSPLALGSRVGTVSIVSNADGSPHQIQMSGTGCRYFSPAAARFFLTSC